VVAQLGGKRAGGPAQRAVISPAGPPRRGWRAVSRPPSPVPSLPICIPAPSACACHCQRLPPAARQHSLATYNGRVRRRHTCGSVDTCHSSAQSHRRCEAGRRHDTQSSARAAPHAVLWRRAVRGRGRSGRSRWAHDDECTRSDNGDARFVCVCAGGVWSW